MAQSSVFLGRREGEDLGVVRNSKREMHSLRQSSQPSGVRTVGAEPAPLERTAGKRVLRGASLKKAQEGEASRRGGGSDTGDFAEDRLRLWEGEVGGYLEMKKPGTRTEWGLWGALWRIKFRF